MVNFMVLLILHFMGDFYLQSSKIAKCKNANVGERCNSCNSCKKNSLFNSKYLIIHTLLYLIPFLALFFITKCISAILIIIILSSSHYIIDTISCCLNKKFKQTPIFIADQILHICILFAINKLFDFNCAFLQYETVIKIILVSLFIILPSSIIVNKLFQDLFPNDEKGKIFDVGSIIGILERILVLIFACFGDFAAIAIIITVKTWARSGDLKGGNDFRNKYLLGTLASLVLALIAFLIYKV